MRWRPRAAGAGLLEGQHETVSQSRKLLCSVSKKIARAATEELAERLSIPDLTVRAFSNPRGLEQSFFPCFYWFFWRCN